MATTYNDNNQVNAPKALDNKRGKFASGVWRPYNNVAEALASVTFRHVGLTVDILKDGVLTEYWWRDNTTDGGLIEKTSSGEITIDPTPTNGSDNAVASNGVFDALATKQDTLVSGTNIKTINGTTVLGSGDITISGGTIDAVPTDGSSNAVSSNGTFDALALKAPLASPTFTGTVSGITKTMVGLGNADDTSDANKPVSTAQQTALDLKANLASPTFTGTVVLPSTTSIGNVSSTEIGYIDGVTSSIQTQLDGKVDKILPIKTVSSLPYTIVDGDNNFLILVTSATAGNIVLDGSVTTGINCLIKQKGAGQITFVTGSGSPALESAGSRVKTTQQYSNATIIKESSTVWTLGGDLTA